MPGNTLAKGNKSNSSVRIAELRAMWFSAITNEDMDKIKTELFNLACSAKNEEVRLRALVYVYDRLLGKPTENVNLAVEGDSPLMNVNLSAAQMTAATEIIKELSASRQPDGKPLNGNGTGEAVVINVKPATEGN